MSVAGIVLAAGASARMGRPKMLLPWGAGTLLSSAVGPLLDAGLDPVVVVLGHEAEAVRRGARLPDDPRLHVVVNGSWAEGMASSLRRGLAECAGAEAALVALGDHPGLSAELVRRVAGAWRPGVPLVVPTYEDRAVHPVLFASALWSELEALSGDVGAREVVLRHAADAVLVPGEPPRDVDDAQDYRALLEGRPPRAGEGLRLPPRGKA